MKLQERFNALSPIYRNGLTNHLPMMITALRRLNVSDNDIKVIAELYVEEKGIVSLSDKFIHDDPYDLEYIRLTNYFTNEINMHGKDGVIKYFLSNHKYALHSALFHGLIRLAYAYIEENDLLVAQALAYFDLSSEELRLTGESTSKYSMDALLELRSSIEIAPASTMGKFRQLLEHEEIVSSLWVPRYILDNKDKVLEFFIDQYMKTDDFYTLHVITGYHALDVLSHLIVFDEEEIFNNFFMQGLLIMLLREYQEIEPYQGEIKSLDKVLQNAYKLRDAHDIKLLYTMYYFHNKYGIKNCKIIANHIIRKGI